MSVTTRGWGVTGGIITTAGFGGGIVKVITKKARGFSGDLVHLIIDLRFKQVCVKQNRNELRNRVVTELAGYDTLNSGLTAQEVSLRDLERQMRILLRRRRQAL